MAEKKSTQRWKLLNYYQKKSTEQKIVKLEIPTVFGKSAEVVQTKIEEIQPDVVLNIGQAGGRFAISPERVAINVDDARIPDNEGNQPVDEAIQPQGQPAYFSRLPIKAMVAAMKKAGIPAVVSNTAGTFCLQPHHVSSTIHDRYKNTQRLKGLHSCPIRSGASC